MAIEGNRHAFTPARHSFCCPSRGSGRLPGSPIPSLAVTPAVTRSPPRNSPVTRSRTPKPSPVVLLGTHPSPVVLRGSCNRYRPLRYNAINSRIPLHPSPSSLKLCINFSYLQTTALMLAFSEHLRDNYSLATYGCDYTFYDHNHPEELPLELKHSFKIVVADPPYLDNSSLLEKVVPSGGRAVHCCDNSLFLKQNHISRGITFSREAKMLWDLNWVSSTTSTTWSDVENNTYYVDFPGCYDALLRPSGCPLLWLELWKHTRDFWLGNSWILDSVVWCFSIRKNSKLEIRDVEVDSEATVIRWPKGHATKLTSFQESNSEIQTSCSDIAKSTMDITNCSDCVFSDELLFHCKIQKEEAKIVAWESQQKANCTIQGRKLVSDHCFHLVTGPDRRIFLPEGLLYDLREGGLRGLEEGGTAKEIEFKLFFSAIATFLKRGRITGYYDAL
ncbi:hypothetical protein Ahy_B08g090535 [Arachis hypogaea]|uniref:Uncharacterized protein n=1 Tax=Arachis hypogaea TaxID=3818 RepID=A0A444Y0C6_ARAHY|nr:hypothetical protein Ahy_B08g090535 [Arachis hypogaea]